MPATFFSRAKNVFNEARAKAGGDDHFISVGGDRIKLSFAGTSLRSMIVPALKHLMIEPISSPDMTVFFWDSGSTGTTMAKPTWSWDAYGRKGEIEGFNDDRFQTVFQHGVNALHMLDREERQALYWVKFADQLPYWEKSFPMRTLIHWWFRFRPLQPMHAAAVGNQTGGVLLAGQSGSGKSTTALTCLENGMLYAGDDYVLAQVEPQPYVYSLYNTVKLEADNLARFPHLSSAVSNPERLGDEKAMIFLSEMASCQLSRGFPLKAIFIPRITGRRTTELKPASPIAALKALAPTTVFHLPSAGQEAFFKMRDLTKKLPAYFLDLGTELVQIPKVISSFLDGGAK